MSFHLPADEEYLSAIFCMISNSGGSSSSSSPGTLLLSFEAALRHSCQQDTPGTSLEQATAAARSLSRMAVVRHSSLQQLVGRASLQQLVRSSLQQQREQQQLLDQLFALQVSCLKHAWGAFGKAHTLHGLGVVHDVMIGVSASCSSVITAISNSAAAATAAAAAATLPRLW
uniref:Uncharacterized protein n=1 Tax=Tetradesmus obliquus TaxID=3088 RepID=A0A383VGA7_TETOB|eukprot:jgi/Sobl393_1/19965/SZX64595.1